MPSMTMSTTPSSEFDVVATYRQLLHDDPDLTMPVAAIEALVVALSQHPSTTVSETLTLLTSLTSQLKSGVRNPIALSAGTDLFQRYIITTLQRPTYMGSASSSGSPESDFDSIRTHLIQNGRLFVARAKEARERIASFGRHFIRDGHVVLTNGGSRVVGALLQSAAEKGGRASSTGASTGGSGSAKTKGAGGGTAAMAGGGGGSVRFKVIYVQASASGSSDEEKGHVSALRRLGVPVATIPATAMAYCLGQVTSCFVGAEGVVENGGIISRLGTYQMGMLAKQAGKPFYVVAESHKFVRLYPLGQDDLGIEQNVVDFRTTDEVKVAPGQPEQEIKLPSGGLDEAVDFTPPHLISGIITESGVLLPSAVSEELIKIWF